MRRFTALFRLLDGTTSTNDKVSALAHYFCNTPSADATWALYLLIGKRRRRLITSRALRQYFLQVRSLPVWLFEECYAHVGDSAETLALLLPNHRGKGGIGELSLSQLMAERLVALADQEDGVRCETVQAWWDELDTDGVFVLNKILTGGFRVGVSRKLVVRGLAKAFGVAQPVLLHRLMGHWQPSAEFFEALVAPDEGTAEPSRPYPFFLASPLEKPLHKLGQPTDWDAEWKWDGIRGQIIQRRGEFFIWSRGEDLVTERFPELADLNLPDGTVLDGELIAWRNDEPLPFALLQKRIGRRKPGKRILATAPVAFLAYDLMESNGEDRRGEGYRQRRKRLADVVANCNHPRLRMSETVAFNDWESLDNLRQGARERGVEGLMVKQVASPYGTGRKRGDWWKYKVDPFTLDAVLIYAQAGSGRRANLFTDYTFALHSEAGLVPFAKAYSGLDNQEIASLDRWIRRNTLAKFGPVRSVRAVQVFEIAFEGIAVSKRHKSGVAVRFPRIVRWRKDKQPDEADHLDRAKALLP